MLEIFCGICYRNGIVDVAPASVENLKGKKRRKLFENPVEHELTWVRWYFPHFPLKTETAE